MPFAKVLEGLARLGCHVPPAHARPLAQLLMAVGRNWVPSSRRLGSRVAVEGPRVVPTVSAATASHPATTAAAIDDIFAFLDRAAARRTARRDAKRGRS